MSGPVEVSSWSTWEGAAKVIGRLYDHGTVRITDSDGDVCECTMDEFVEANEPAEFVPEVVALGVGESVEVGGGAAPRIVIRRLS